MRMCGCSSGVCASDRTVRLAVDGLSVAAEALHGIDLKHISFDVRAGEVFGIAGVAGNGQNELLLALSGERLAGTAAALRIDGEAVGRRDAGEDRKSTRLNSSH